MWFYKPISIKYNNFISKGLKKHFSKDFQIGLKEFLKPLLIIIKKPTGYSGINAV